MADSPTDFFLPGLRGRRPEPARRACRIAWSAACLLALLPTSDQAAGPQRRREDSVLDLDGRDMHIDYRGTVSLKDVVITQGTSRIQADHGRAEGTGLQLDNSTWVFSGNVRIRFEETSLTANEATVHFADNRVVSMSISGNPAQFEQRVAKYPEPARGHAGTIDYEVGSGNVLLKRDAWLAYGPYEFRTESIIYSLREQTAQSDNKSGDGGRVHIRVRPQNPGDPAPAGEAPAQQPPAPGRTP